MKLLTFLGVADYKETLYTWKDQQVQAKYAPLAACKFLNPKSITLFLTEDAQEKVADFKSALSPQLELNLVPIPLGKNQEELWQIFDLIASSVEPFEEVAFDITHGLRSSPLLGLLAAGFLSSGLNVQLKAVLYGAYDVGKVVSPGITPMFDLSPMLALLQWSAASDRFNQTGDARHLASLLREHRKALAVLAQDDPAGLMEVGHLGNLASGLEDISQSLKLIRPYQALVHTDRLPNLTKKARPLLERTPTTRPFYYLLENVEKSFAELGMADAEDPQNLSAALDKQRLVIHWYIQHEHWVQAVTLCREWLISWVMARLNRPAVTNRNLREQTEKDINADAYSLRQSQQLKTVFTASFLAAIPDVEHVLDLWNKLTNVRNDIDHAGMRESAKSPESLIKVILKVKNEIDVLALP